MLYTGTRISLKVFRVERFWMFGAYEERKRKKEKRRRGKRGKNERVPLNIYLQYD